MRTLSTISNQSLSGGNSSFDRDTCSFVSRDPLPLFNICNCCSLRLIHRPSHCVATCSIRLLRLFAERATLSTPRFSFLNFARHFCLLGGEAGKGGWERGALVPPWAPSATIGFCIIMGYVCHHCHWEGIHSRSPWFFFVPPWATCCTYICMSPQFVPA